MTLQELLFFITGTRTRNHILSKIFPQKYIKPKKIVFASKGPHAVDQTLNFFKF